MCHTLAAAGVSYLAAAVSIAVELWMHPQPLPTCADNLNRVCTDTVPVMQHAIAGGLALLVIGVIALLGRRLAMAAAAATITWGLTQARKPRYLR